MNHLSTKENTEGTQKVEDTEYFWDSETELQVEADPGYPLIPFGYEFYTVFKGKDFVEWAIYLLDSGIKSEPLSILSKLKDSDEEQQTDCFLKACQDLHVAKWEAKALYAEYFMFHLAKKVLDRQINPKLGLKIASDISEQTACDLRYEQFSCLYDDIDLLITYGEPLFSESLSKDKIDDHIRTEFELFISKSERFNSQDLDLTNLDYCENCHSLTTPTTKKVFKYFSSPFDYICCEKCYSKNILSGTSQEGRIKILEALNAP